MREKIRQILKAKAIGRQYYARADRLLDALAAVLPVGVPVPLDTKGKTATLVDPFGKKFVAFRPLGFRRFELEVKD